MISTGEVADRTRATGPVSVKGWIGSVSEGGNDYTTGCSYGGEAAED